MANISQPITMLENELVRLTIETDGRFALYDRRTGEIWESQYAGWITLDDEAGIRTLNLVDPAVSTPAPGSVALRFAGGGEPDGKEAAFRVTVIIRLTECGVDIEIQEIETACKLVDLEYPSRLVSVPTGASDSYVVVPFKQGVLIPSRLDAGFMRFMHNTWKAISDIDRRLPFESGALNMPWFGAANGNSGLFAYIPEAADCSLHVIGNGVIGTDGKMVETVGADETHNWRGLIGPKGEIIETSPGKAPGVRLSSLSPVWQSSRNQLGYRRILKLEFVPGGYVGMAKRYRQIAKNTGRHVTLKEKIAANPLVERLIGAPDIKMYIYTNRPNTPYLRAWSEPVLDGYSAVHTTFDQVREMAEELVEAGVDRSLILLGGWNRNGYDNQHVDMWPPAEAAGGADALAIAAKAVGNLGYLFSLHDNYQDYYVDAPTYDEKYIAKNEDGSLQIGGIWDGGLCRLICSKTAFELADRTLDAVQDTLEIGSYYLDTTTAVKLRECFDADHPLTRQDDRKNKIALLKSLNERGLVAGGEGGTDWAVPYCAFFEGLPGEARGYSFGAESATFGLVAPLFNLVYHDAVVCYWQHGQPFGRDDHANHVLHDLMSGQPSSWSLVHEQWEDMLPLIKQTYELLGTFHRRTAHQPMTDHKYLRNDFTVHQTCFADGSEVIVNFGIVSYRDGDNKIPPKGFALKLPGQPDRIGSIPRAVSYEQA